MTNDEARLLAEIVEGSETERTIDVSCRADGHVDRYIKGTYYVVRAGCVIDGELHKGPCLITKDSTARNNETIAGWKLADAHFEARKAAKSLATGPEAYHDRIYSARPRSQRAA